MSFEPFQILSTAEHGSEKWAFDLLSSIKDISETLEQPYKSMAATALQEIGKNVISPSEANKAKAVADWMFNEGSSFMDHLPPYTTIEITSEGTQIVPDMDAVKVSPDVFISAEGGEVPPEKYEYYQNNQTKTVYKKVDNAWTKYF